MVYVDGGGVCVYWYSTIAAINDEYLFPLVSSNQSSSNHRYLNIDVYMPKHIHVNT